MYFYDGRFRSIYWMERLQIWLSIDRMTSHASHRSLVTLHPFYSPHYISNVRRMSGEILALRVKKQGHCYLPTNLSRDCFCPTLKQINMNINSTQKSPSHNKDFRLDISKFVGNKKKTITPLQLFNMYVDMCNVYVGMPQERLSIAVGFSVSLETTNGWCPPRSRSSDKTLEMRKTYLFEIFPIFSPRDGRWLG